MGIHRNLYDAEPIYPGAVVREFTISWDEEREFETYATVWDDDRQAFVDVLADWSNRNTDAWVIVDATAEIQARWEGLPAKARRVLEPGPEPTTERRFGLTRNPR